MSQSDLPHISVCVPTFRRPVLLNRCLEAMQNQQSRGFSYSIVVVDNDAEESARDVIDLWRERSSVPIRYEVEPVQNISLARNRAVASGEGKFIAFIDDDEYPDPTWLQEMFEAFGKIPADGFLGPVIPYYEGSPPKWLVKSGLCARRAFETGANLTNLRYMSTANVMICRNISEGEEQVFDPRYGLTGGEDSDFFDRMMKKGRRFYWCNEAVVHEAVPKRRQSRAYHLQRAMIRGLINADQLPLFGLATLKSVAAVIAYSLSLPFMALVGQHVFMKYLIRDCDHLGKLLACCGIKPVSKRTFQ
ncbi:MAG: glycosyltransferase [Syntrophobacteraceae bacterium]|nr:glycosyltransferase [Syntrophobacteraceae bacterium]